MFGPYFSAAVIFFTNRFFAWPYPETEAGEVEFPADGEERCAMVVKNEKRMGRDRRTQESGPPNGWRERRKSVERRLLEVDEIPFSEWLAYRPVRAEAETQK